jgi:hypothetical protein
MKRWVLFVLVIGLSMSATAGEFEKSIKGRWLGAWLLLNVESYSHCNGLYTNNRINGEFVKSKGNQHFEPGELVKLDRLDIKKSRLDLQLSVYEAVLSPYSEGPFTLYRELQCRIEFEVMLPRDVVKQKRTDAVDEALLSIVERHARRDDATASSAWNGREREAYPEDYDRTLAELDVWHAKQTNRSIEQRIEVATQRTYRLTDRVSSDPNYLSGFAVGVEQAKSFELDTCPELLALNLDELPARTTPPVAADDLGRERNQRGFKDGELLIVGLEMLRRLPDCFVPIPDVEEILVGSNY